MTTVVRRYHQQVVARKRTHLNRCVRYRLRHLVELRATPADARPENPMARMGSANTTGNSGYMGTNAAAVLSVYGEAHTFP